MQQAPAKAEAQWPIQKDHVNTVKFEDCEEDNSSMLEL